MNPTSPRPTPAIDDVLERLPGPDAAGVLLLCDHASNRVPAACDNLGLTPAHFEQHIAYDIGAAEVTRHLASMLAAPAILTGYSRLLIDPNRGADDPTLVMRLSDGALIPGNATIDSAGIERRRQHYWQPYREAVRLQIDAMLATGVVPALVSLHSFTPVWRGEARPWQVGLLWDMDDRIVKPLLASLRTDGLCVGDNEPYDGALEGDTLYEHGTLRGLPHVLIELRQDLVADAAGAQFWAELLARHLRPVLAAPGTHIIARAGSRTWRRPEG